MINEWIHQEDITALNMYGFSNIVSQYIKQTLTKLKEQTNIHSGDLTYHSQ